MDAGLFFGDAAAVEVLVEVLLEAALAAPGAGLARFGVAGVAVCTVGAGAAGLDAAAG